MAAYSYSKIKKYFTCPRLFQFHYLENLRGLEPIFFKKGTIGHSMLEKYEIHCKQNKINTDYSYIDTLTEEFVSENLMHEDFIRNFSVQIRNVSVPERIIGIEMKLAVDKNNEIIDDFFDKDVFYRLIADLVYFDTDIEGDTIIVIRDYKTGYTTDYELEQLENEAWILHILFPNAKSICVEFSFINENRYYQSPRYTITNFEEIENRVRKQINIIESDNRFQPIGGNHCNYCPHLNRCMAKGGIILKEETVFHDRPITAENAVMVAEFYERLQIYTKKIGESLEGYCKEFGNIKTKDNVYGIGIKPTLTAPYLKKDESIKTELTKTLNKYGINISNYINLDSRKLKSVQKELSDEQNEKLKEMLEKNPAGEFLKEIGYDISELGNYDSTKLKEIAENNPDIRKCLIEKPNEKYTILSKKEIEE